MEGPNTDLLIIMLIFVDSSIKCSLNLILKISTYVHRTSPGITYITRYQSLFSGRCLSDSCRPLKGVHLTADRRILGVVA